MQRVRTGLTGLAAIFLMVLIAAAGLKPDHAPAPRGAPGETLAVLGVAPGSGAEAAHQAAATPASRAAPATRQRQSPSR